MVESYDFSNSSNVETIDALENVPPSKRAGREWFVAESLVVSAGVFSTFVMAVFALGSPGFPFYSSVVLPIFIISVPVVGWVVYARRKRASGVALVGGSVLSSYAWLQFVVVLIGFGWGFIRLIVLMVLLAWSMTWILGSSNEKM